MGKRVILIAALLTLLAGPVTAQQPPTRVQVEGLSEVLNALGRVEQKLDRLLIGRWEYRTVQRNRFDDELDVIDSLGQEGWELVGVTVEEGFIFKRRVLPR